MNELQEKIRVLEKPEWNWFFQSHNAIFLSNLGAQISFSIVLFKNFPIFVSISKCSFQTNITSKLPKISSGFTRIL